MSSKNSVPEELKDFRNFLYIVWKHLNLPDPTDIQYEIAEWMQNGPRRAVIQGFRGVGKSWICSAYVVHQLLLDPSKNILVCSASKTRADDFSTFTLRLIQEMPILAHLIPTDEQRFSKIEKLTKIGDPSEEILNTSDEINADIIAVGNSGMRGIRGILGSVTRYVLNHSKCSVLIGRTE